MTAVWITDGSLPVFSDTRRLRTRHPVMFGLRTRYEGFVDPEAPHVGAFLFRSTCGVSSVRLVWSRLWSSQAESWLDLLPAKTR
jgi:hypothetical protein